MPPHCDSMDGPVVVAARQAIRERNVNVVLPFVHAEGEGEVRLAFDRALGAHDGNPAANEIADLYFFETVVRVHRAGEGAPYTGLKPAGLDVGPVIPVAERAIETGTVEELEGLLEATVSVQVRRRFARAMELKPHSGESIEHARAYVQAMLGLQVWSHKLYACAVSGPHGEAGEPAEGTAVEAHEH